MEEQMTCPVCGKKFDAMKYVIDDNGNPICPDCANKENEEEKY